MQKLPRSDNPQLRVDEATGLLRPPVCLMSEIVDTMRYAALSNHQRVTLQGGDAKYAMAWCVSHISDRKYHSIGEELVQANKVSSLWFSSSRNDPRAMHPPAIIDVLVSP